MGPADVTDTVVSQLNDLPDRPLSAVATTDARAAIDRLSNGEISGVYVPAPTSSSDRLLIASAGGASVATSLRTSFSEISRGQGREITFEDVHPVQPGDGNGLTGFYLAVGWIIGGYLLAAVLGVVKGARPTGLRAARHRLAVFVPYAVASGFLGALVVGPLLGALDANIAGLTVIGTLTVLASAATTIALQTLFGIAGIALTILIFVVLGNPSAGGAYQAQLLPTFWRWLNAALPNGAATESIRRIAYFGGTSIGGSLALLVCYVAVPTVVTLTVILLRQRRAPTAT